MVQELIKELTEIIEGAKALKAENEELKANAVDPAEVEELKAQIEEIKAILFGKPVEPEQPEQPVEPEEPVVEE